jgi:hypothetical protein
MNKSNEMAKLIVAETGGRFLDRDNINWRFVDGEWIGKRAIFTKDFRACWLEETTADNVRNWWHGMEADYNEVFKN